MTGFKVRRCDEPIAAIAPQLTAFELARSELGDGSMLVADIGARFGAEASWYRLRPLARVAGFEPDEVECDRLNARAAEGERFYPVALGRTPGRADLYVTAEPGCSSLYPPSKAVTDRYPHTRQRLLLQKVSSVEVSTLDEWVSKTSTERIDFMKIDTQGSELDILIGAGAVLDDCLGVEVEVEFSPLYDGQPVFSDVDEHLRSRGFHLWHLNNPVHFTETSKPTPSHRLGLIRYGAIEVLHETGAGRLMWADAVYFRDWRSLTSRRDCLLLASLLEAAGDYAGAAEAIMHAETFGETLVPEARLKHTA